MINEAALAFVFSSCGVCKRTAESLTNDFLKHDIMLSFIRLKRNDPKAQELGIKMFPAFYIGDIVFYSVYDQIQLKLAVDNIKAKYNVKI